MEKFLFVLTRGTEDPTRVTRCLQLVKVAKEEGHEVHLFLTDEGVYLAKKGLAKNVVAPTGDDAATHMQSLVQQKVPLYVCIPCAQARQVDEKELVETAKFDTAKTLIALAAGATVFTF